MVKTASHNPNKVVPAGGKPSRIRVYQWLPVTPGDPAPKKNELFVDPNYPKKQFQHTYHVVTGDLDGDAGDEKHAKDVDYEAALAVYDMEPGAVATDPWPAVNSAFTDL